MMTGTEMKMNMIMVMVMMMMMMMVMKMDGCTLIYDHMAVCANMYNGSRSLEGALDVVAAIGSGIIQEALCALFFYI